MEIINIPTGALVDYDKNAKIHTQDQVDRLAKAIKEFGFRVPILVRPIEGAEYRGIDGEWVDSYMIVAGHGRVMAAKQLGLETVPAHPVDDLNEQQIKALRIADNKLNESAWDKEVLAEEYGELEEYYQELTAVELEDLNIDIPDAVKENTEVTEDDLGDFVKCPQCGFHVTTN